MSKLSNNEEQYKDNVVGLSLRPVKRNVTGLFTQPTMIYALRLNRTPYHSQEKIQSRSMRAENVREGTNM